jgi:DtxR family Mn-dependent transcriptional regulator
MTDNRSESVEMYLKTLAELGGKRDPVAIGRIASRLGISPVSASEMIRRLGDLGYIDHLPYKGVKLTATGRQVANSVIRRQRLWECFLVGRLMIDWARSYDLACSLEHATSPELTEALAEYLDNPGRCPHGNPIPDGSGKTPIQHGKPLSELEVGETGQIQAIVPENQEVLTYLAERKLQPGQHVELIASAPLDGPLSLNLEGREVVVGINMADRILIESEPGDDA